MRLAWKLAEQIMNQNSARLFWLWTDFILFYLLSWKFRWQHWLDLFSKRQKVLVLFFLFNRPSVRPKHSLAILPYTMDWKVYKTAFSWDTYMLLISILKYSFIRYLRVWSEHSIKLKKWNVLVRSARGDFFVRSLFYKIVWIFDSPCLQNDDVFSEIISIHCSLSSLERHTRF